jgi:hypothetical protein
VTNDGLRKEAHARLIARGKIKLPNKHFKGRGDSGAEIDGICLWVETGRVRRRVGNRRGEKTGGVGGREGVVMIVSRRQSCVETEVQEGNHPVSSY